MRLKMTLIATAATLLVSGCSTQTQHVNNGTWNTAQNRSGDTSGVARNVAGTSNASSTPAGDTPLQNHAVNGCTPPSVFGPFCISTVPVWTQSSAGLTEWTQIEVGALVEVKGATIVNAQSGKPFYHNVEITGPGDFQQMLPVASNGGYDKDITFPRPGTYQIGVVKDGKLQSGLPFSVFYVPHPQVSTTLTHMFPNSRRRLPHDIVLMFPYGKHPTVAVQFTTAQGQPASRVTLQTTQTPMTTDAEGVAKASLAPGKPFLGIRRVYGGLFALSYLEGRVSHGVVTSWPKEMQTKKTPVSPANIVRGGVTYYETSSALNLLDPRAFYNAYSRYVPETYNQSTGVLTIQPLTGVGQVKVTPDGLVKIGVPVARVHPIVQSGKLYLDVPDLVTLVNAFAWASLSSDGTLRVADFLYP